jgi:hypothetical protein
MLDGWQAMLGWFQWLIGYISISATPRQLSLSPTSAPAADCSIQSIATSASVFSLPINTTISDLTILEFISWTMNLRKHTNFIRLQNLNRYSTWTMLVASFMTSKNAMAI